MMKRNIATLVMGAGVIAGVFCGPVLAGQTPDPAKIAAGQKIYDTEKCNTCHQIKGVGGKLSTALDGVGGKLSEADIRKWLTTPAAMETTLPKKPPMPMSTYLKSHKLADADIDALTAYMLSLK
jgi:mono/diheme cytochrome c family protein